MKRKYEVKESVDLPGTKPSLIYNLKWVGIEGLKSYICFKPLFKNDLNPTQLMCNVDMYTDLNRNRRGVHLSRLSEEFLKLSNEKTFYNVAVFCKKLADNIRSSQKQQYSKVNITTKHIIKKETSVTSKVTLIPLQIGMTVITFEESTIYLSSLSAETIIVCPCGVEMFKTILKHNTKRNNVDNIYPSHSQSAILKFSIASSIPVPHNDLFEITKKTIPLIGTTLKRPDEFDLLNNVFNNPLFCEDLARVALDKVIKYINIDEVLKIEVSIRSKESIHPYSVVAYGEMLGKKQYIGSKLEASIKGDVL